MRKFSMLLLALWLAGAAHALTLDQLTGQDAAGGLKEALSQGASKAVGSLGTTDGFLGNPKVRIPLPGQLEKVAGLMRKFGMGAQVNELETAMNRAAEAAVPQARQLLADSIKSMSVQDAKGILTGGDNAATDYFRRTTSAPLTEKFKPIVQNAMAQTRLSESYARFAGKATKFGVLSQEDSQLDGYVTRKTLDGLYMMIGEEEKAIRQNPVGAASQLAKKVFGALGK